MAAVGYASWALERFLGRLSSSDPAPGGGAAAALTAALALALSGMVAGINARRGHRPSGLAAKRLAKLRRRALAAAGKDAKAFAVLSAFPREARGSQPHRRAALAAASVPLELCALAVEGSATLLPERTRTGRWLMSDLIEAALLYEAAFRSARLNVEINLSSLDAREAARFRKRLASLQIVLERRLRAFRRAG